jgi:hypothetical protein
MPLGTGFRLAAGAAFRDSPWSPDHFARVVLGDFVKAPGPPPWDGMLVGVAPPDPATAPGQATINAELSELDELVYYRPSVLAEATAQNSGILQYFSGILDFDLRSRPATVYLCVVALRIASFQAMHYKYKYDRVRPPRLSPRLMPPIEPPGHASFPSGHATQARLIALCLEQVMPANIIPVDNGVPQPQDGPLRKMADRIARNREVLGLHYPSDSAAGKQLADETFNLLRTLPKVSNAAAGALGLIQVAQTEWA